MGHGPSITRPADVLIAGWDRGKPSALDIMMTSPLTPALLGESCGMAALAAETRKHLSNGLKLGGLAFPWEWRPLGTGVKMLKVS